MPKASFDPKVHMAALADNKEITVWKLGQVSFSLIYMALASVRLVDLTFCQGAISSYLYNFALPFNCATPPRVRLFTSKGALRVDSYALFACSADGNLVLWYSLSYNQGQYTQHQIPLKLGETVTALSELFDGRFVAGTSSGEIHVIDVQLEGSISVESLRKRNSMLQRVGSWLTGVNSSPLRTLLSTNPAPLIRGKHEEIVRIQIDSRPNKFQQT